MSSAISTIQSALPSWDYFSIKKGAATNLPDWQPLDNTQKTPATKDLSAVPTTTTGTNKQADTAVQTISVKQSNNGELTADQQKTVEEDKATDRKVRAHERAHLAAAGSLAMSGANFSYVTGPDGVRYAVAGDVTIDTSPISNDPEATLRKAQEIIRAALAPSDPSPQDLRVAANAEAMASRALQELMKTKLSAASEPRPDRSREVYPRFIESAQPSLINIEA